MATRANLARGDSDSGGDLQQPPSLLLGYGACAPALHGIRINIFVVHFPHHRHMRKVRSCHHSMHPIFKSAEENITAVQTRRYFWSSCLKPLML